MTIVPITPDTSLVVKCVLASALAAHLLWRNEAVREWDAAVPVPGAVRGLAIAVAAVVMAGLVHWGTMFLTVASNVSWSLAVAGFFSRFPMMALYTMVKPNLNLVFPILYAGAGIALARFERTPAAPLKRPERPLPQRRGRVL